MEIYTAQLCSYGNGIYALPDTVKNDIHQVISVQFGGIEQPGFTLVNNRAIKYKCSFPAEMGCGEIRYIGKHYDCEPCICL